MSVCCLICEKIFSTQSTLNRHLREKHDLEKKNIVSYERNVHTFKCNECGCNSSFINNQELRLHLDDGHGIKTNLMEVLKFSSYEGKFFNFISLVPNFVYKYSYCVFLSS